MSNNTKIFSEAIAEAKAIRETALANAKLALEEAFAPRIKEMMSSKLEALSEEDEMEETYNKEMEEGNMKPEMENMEEEISLEELLAELETLEEDQEVVEEAAEEMEEDINLEEATDEDEVGEITVDELKTIIRDIMTDLMGGADTEEMESEEEMEPEEEMESEEEEISLDEILAEIGSLDETEEVEEEVYEAKKASLKDKELEEAMSTIATLRSELNEVNLLNAKLLYVNKLFKSKTLNESQKVKVINAFDRAETVKEAKNIFETLNESLSISNKTPLKENLSFASKAVGVADKKMIVESNDFVARMQKLAGINQ